MFKTRVNGSHLLESELIRLDKNRCSRSGDRVNQSIKQIVEENELPRSEVIIIHLPNSSEKERKSPGKTQPTLTLSCPHLRRNRCPRERKPTKMKTDVPYLKENWR